MKEKSLKAGTWAPAEVTATQSLNIMPVLLEQPVSTWNNIHSVINQWLTPTSFMFCRCILSTELRFQRAAIVFFMRSLLNSPTTPELLSCQSTRTRYQRWVFKLTLTMSGTQCSVWSCMWSSVKAGEGIPNPFCRPAYWYASHNCHSAAGDYIEGRHCIDIEIWCMSDLCIFL